MTKLQRRVRREANRLIARRRYRERHGKQPPAAVWSVRVGPAAPSHKVVERKRRVVERLKLLTGHKVRLKK